VLIIAWGYQPERSQASIYLIIYTVTASLPILASIIKVSLCSKTSIIPIFIILSFPCDYPSIFIAYILIIAGFLVKLPLFTVHL
jgi:NADH:ubiquinone oxidoreductase subunit 4 (subunit M)